MANKYNSFQRFSIELSPELLAHSEEQDFLLNQKFSIKITNRFKSFIFNLKSSIMYSWLITKAGFIGNVDRKKIPLGASVKDIQNEIKEINTKEKFKAAFNSTLFESLRKKTENYWLIHVFNLLDKTVFFSMLIPVFIIFIIYLPFHFLYQVFIKSHHSFKTAILRNAEGFYNSAGGSSTVFVHERNSQGDLFEPVVSHEHLHFVQNCFITHEKSYYFRFLKENWKCLFNYSRPKDISEIEYLFESIEIEARLHELVICHFREFHAIPENHTEFVDFLNRFRFYPLIFRNNETDKNEIKKLLVSRFPGAVEDTFFLINRLLADENKHKFFIEVLPVFYSNLLIYYGFTSLSSEFLKTVPNSGLLSKIYRADEFYGE